VDGLCTLIAAPDEKRYPGFRDDPGQVTKRTAWGRVGGPGTFYRRQVVEKVGGFDEALGIAPANRYASSEDIDLALRALKAGFKLYYDPRMVVYHPDPTAGGFAPLIPRAYPYGLGMGRVWRKHDFPLAYVGYRLLRSAGGALISLLSGKRARARYQWLNFYGKLAGWREQP